MRMFLFFLAGVYCWYLFVEWFFVTREPHLPYYDADSDGIDR